MRIIWLWFVFCVCLFSFCLAQENQIEDMVNATLDANEFTEKSKNIQDIDISFCNQYGVKSVFYDVSLWKKYDICLNLFNGSDRDVVVNIWFVDGMLTNDQRKNKACGNNDDIDWFGRYVTWYETSISLKKNETKTELATLQIPENVSITWSNIDWCLIYSLSSDDVNWSGLVGFDIVVRKAKFITLNIEKVPSLDFRYFIVMFIVLFILFFVFRRRIFSSK